MNMLALLKDKGATILMVTHSPEHGAKADRIIEMLDGQVPNNTHGSEATDEVETAPV